MAIARALDEHHTLTRKLASIRVRDVRYVESAYRGVRSQLRRTATSPLKRAASGGRNACPDAVAGVRSAREDTEAMQGL